MVFNVYGQCFFVATHSQNFCLVPEMCAQDKHYNVFTLNQKDSMSCFRPDLIPVKPLFDKLLSNKCCL